MATVETARAAGPPLVSYAALVLGAVAMGVSPLLVRVAEVGPFASAFWRTALALPLLWAWDRSESSSGSSAGSGAFLTWPLLMAGLAFAGDLFFWHLAIMGTTVANATFFATTAPVFVVLISWAVLRQRIERNMLVGLLLALFGGTALIGDSLQFAPQRLLGDAFGIATAFFFGLYFLIVQSARRTCGTARLIFVSTLVTAAVLFIVAIASGDTMLPATAKGLLALVALALISHAGGQGLLAYALGHLPATFSSLVIFLEAVVAACLAWLLLDEPLSMLQMLGGIVILGGIWIARPTNRDRLPA
jgi:drug/metabolite transporter (DMT)-like permease